METLTDPNIWLALLTLTALEIVLGIDNIVFISILASKLPAEQARKARIAGLAIAMISRILLLFSLAWVMRLTTPLFHIFGREISGRDLILIVGGLFLLYKSTREIHERLEGVEGHANVKTVPSFSAIVIQIGLLDIIFSLDSVITAVGMARDIWVMVTAIVIAVVIMMVASGSVSDFVNRHPTIKILALSFLLLIGFALLVEAFELHIPKGYIYFAMGFSVFVEMLNLRMVARSANPVNLHQPITPAPSPAEVLAQDPLVTRKEK